MMTAAIGDQVARAVRIGTLAVGGDGPVAVLSDGGDSDARWVSLREHHGRADARAVLAEERARWAGPLLVEPFGAGDLPAIGELGDGIVIGSAWMQDFQLVKAVAAAGLPVVVQRGPASTLAEWLGVAEYCVAEGNDAVILCESGSRTAQNGTTLDLAMVQEARRRTGRPVIVETTAGLAAASVATGADGLMVTAGNLAAAREAVLGIVLRPERPETILAARGAIDRVDSALATLLERRADLAGTVQRLKPVGGFRGRDAGRERQIARRMAERAPRLGEVRLRHIMTAVIDSGLDLHENPSL